MPAKLRFSRQKLEIPVDANTTLGDIHAELRKRITKIKPSTEVVIRVNLVCLIANSQISPKKIAPAFFLAAYVKQVFFKK